MKLSDKFRFGKHKDKTLKEIITISPTYVEWALKNVKDFSITKEGHKLLNEQLSHLSVSTYSSGNDDWQEYGIDCPINHF